MWSIPKFGNGNQQNIFVDLSSDEERRRMRCQDLSNAIAEMSKNCTREILLEPIQIDKFSISLEKLKNKYEGMLQLSCILSQDDVMEFAEELFENKSCTVLFNLKVLGLHAFFKMDEENLKFKFILTYKEI